MTKEKDQGAPVGAEVAATSIVDNLVAMFAKEEDKRFEWLAKQYYDLFAYHAAQRLTAFNFFIVSLSFFSNAFAMFVTRQQLGVAYFELACGLALVAWALTLFFARLDKRNEEIIQINERPLKKLQEAVARHFAGEGVQLPEDGDDTANIFRTFREADKSYFLRTFGSILPWIFTLAAFACLAGSGYAALKAGLLECFGLIWTSLGLSVVTVAVVHFPLSLAKNPS